MKLPRRQFLHLTAGAAALPAMARVASALDYPRRPVRIIVGFVAGQNLDITARLIGQWLLERLSQQFVIENRPGAGGNVGAEVVVRAMAIPCSQSAPTTRCSSARFHLQRHVECPLLAQSGHSVTEFRCPLLGVKQTLRGRTPMSASDPKRTFGPEDCCHVK